MSTAELIEELRHRGNRDRLAAIEAATRLIQEDLALAQRQDERLHEQASALTDLYEPDGALTEWTTLDGEEVIDDSSSR